jgi:hypothetical protein
MENDIYSILAFAVLGNLIAYDFKPLQPAKQKFISFFEFIPFISTSLDKLLNCSKCVSFWITLVYYTDIRHAALAGFFGFIVNFINDKIAHWYEG